MRTIGLPLIALFLTVAASCAADEPAELVLSNEFKPSVQSGMPFVAKAPGYQVEKRDYPDFDAVEWQIRLKAPEEGESPIYQDVRCADFAVRFPSEKPVVLHWSNGSQSNIHDFQPHRLTLEKGQPFSVETFGGRSSDGVMPYFNLETDGGGLILAVGWTGDWKASFEATKVGEVRVSAGMKRSHFKLPKDEEVRLPSFLVMPYKGEWLDGQNKFRRFMLTHLTPKSHPPMELMPVGLSVHGMIAFNDTTEKNLTEFVENIKSLGLCGPSDTFWLDAGWNLGGFHRGQGTPEADPERFPNGLVPVGEAVKEAGLRFLVWFEPERVMPNTRLARERPEWLLKPSKTPDNVRYMENDGFDLLDFGNKEAWNWTVETVSKEITASQIDYYRQDFNTYPAFNWHTDEPADEVGLREIRYINGMYDFLDELVRRHPKLILDNCASGGRRLDFEMMRRSVVLWRSDSCWDNSDYPRNVQAMTHGLSHWIPLHGLGAKSADETELRSGMGMCVSFAINYKDLRAVENLKNFIDRFKKIRSLYAADYYPLTDWSDDPNRYLAFQFHDPEKGEGVVQVFRGNVADQETFTAKLKGLNPHKNYLVVDWDAPDKLGMYSGVQLTETGIIGIRSVAAVLHYVEQP